MNFKSWLSLVVIFTQSIQLSKIVRSYENHYALWSAPELMAQGSGLGRCGRRTEHRASLVERCLRENLVELTGIEPMTSCLQSRRSPN